jgi:sulfatase maturation enzyme AslB (radical SAM superfamily)
MFLSAVTVIATSRCNQRCSYCCVTGRPPASPRWAAVRVALDALLASPMNRVKVAFTGGEPLLARALISRTIRYVEAHRRPGQSVRYKLLTNGLLLDGRTLAWLRRREVELRISLDGARSAQELRSAGTFDALDGLIRRLRQRSPDYLRSHVGVAVSLTRESLPLLSESVSYLIKSGIASIRIGAVMDLPERGGDPFPALDRQFARIFETSLAHYRRTGIVAVTAFRNRFPFPVRRPASRWVCRAPLGNHLVVDVDGNLSSCVLATRTYADGRRLTPPVRAAAEALRAGPADERLEERLRHVSVAAAAARIFTPGTARRSARRLCRSCEIANECTVCPLTTDGGSGPGRIIRVPALQCALNRVVAKYRAQFPFQPPPAAARRS